MNSLLKFMRKIFLIIGAIILAPIAYWAVAYVLLLIIGFHPDAIGIDLASEIVASGKSVRECKQIIHPIPHLLAPSTREQRADCIHHYAELQKDPSACELLMPSSYGLSCVGGALNFKRPCALGNDRSVSGNGIEATLQECVNGPKNIQENSCCSAAKARFIISFNDCTEISDSQEIQDECYYNLAFKNHDPSICPLIRHNNLRTACEVQAKALREDPSICTGCVAPISLEEVQKLP